MFDQDGQQVSRRGFLKLLSVGVLGTFGMGSGIAAVSGKDPYAMDLPGEDSIFQPRHDEHLEAWLRKHGRLPQ